MRMISVKTRNRHFTEIEKVSESTHKPACFSIDTNKKLKTLSREFKDCFNLVLIFFDKRKIALANLTLNKLMEKSSLAPLNPTIEHAEITRSMSVSQVQGIFRQSYGVEIQIMDHKMKDQIPGHLTLLETRN